MITNTLTLELLEKLSPEEQAEALRFVQALLARHAELPPMPDKSNFDPMKYAGILKGTTIVEDMAALRKEWDRDIWGDYVPD